MSHEAAVLGWYIRGKTNKIYRNIDFVTDDESYFTLEHINIVGYNFFYSCNINESRANVNIARRQIPSEITRLSMFFAQRYGEHFFGTFRSGNQWFGVLGGMYEQASHFVY